MNLTEAQAWVGRKVLGKVVDEIETNGGPTDRRIYFKSDGERIVNVTQLSATDVPGDLPKLNVGGRHKVVDKRPVVKI
jgi:hypothetical protein